jgi:hypothetical protein
MLLVEGLAAASKKFMGLDVLGGEVGGGNGFVQGGKFGPLSSKNILDFNAQAIFEASKDGGFVPFGAG